jgi:hypothetical protein
VFVSLSVFVKVHIDMHVSSSSYEVFVCLFM